jgi:hypothetical protein
MTIYLHPLPRLRIRGVILPLPHTSSWRGASLIKHGGNFTYKFIHKEKHIENYGIGISSCITHEQKS